MYLRNVISLTLALLACGISGCHIENDARAGAAKMIGVSLPRRDSSYYVLLEQSLRAAATKRGYELVILWANGQLRAQESEIDSFMTQHVDAIVMCAVDSTRIRPAIAKANLLRVPVFLLDVRGNPRTEGATAMNWVAAYFEGRKLPPQNGSPVHLIDTGLPRPSASPAS